jgi:hypothetical protein
MERGFLVALLTAERDDAAATTTAPYTGSLISVDGR